MPSLQEIDAEVDKLNSLPGNSFRFRDALRHIEEASLTPVETAELRGILSRFRGKIPDLVGFKRIRADAKDLAETLMLEDLEDRINRIRVRNDLLTELTGLLQVQVDKANNDATLLTTIKEGVEKATRTVNELRALVDELVATDTATKDRILALIQRLGNISSLLNPA